MSIGFMALTGWMFLVHGGNVYHVIRAQLLFEDIVVVFQNFVSQVSAFLLFLA